MEKPNRIEAEASTNSEAVALVEKHGDFFEHYAKDQVKIMPGDTNSFNFISKEITIDPTRYEGLDFSEEMTIHSTLHEIEHLLEDVQLLSESNGEKSFEKLVKKLESSKAYALMNNSLADIRENRTIISKTNKGMADLEEKKIKEKLFRETDFREMPRHIQFNHAIFRENRVPDEKCDVAPDVRQALDEVAKVEGLMDIMTNPETPMSMRLKLQDKYIWPKVEELMEKDKEDRKNKENQEDREEKQGEEKGEGEEEGEEKNSRPGEEGNKKQKDGKSGKKEKKQEGEEKNKKGGQKNEEDPNVIFADDYAKAKKKFPEAVPIEDVKKEFERWKEERKEKNNADRADEEYAKKIGVKKEDLREYRKIVESLQEMVNPETSVGITEELRNLFARIIAKRFRPLPAPKYSVEEGEELMEPAQLVADVKAGNLYPKVWEDTEIKTKKGDKFGEVEITLVCDRSSSMTGGQKAVEQRRSAVLMMEALKEFADLCEEEKTRVDKPLEIRSEIYTFASSEEDARPLKKMSEELGEAERINVLKKLHNLPGSTTDFACLEAIDSNLDDESKQKIKEGELKKIVIVFTDGGSDDAARVQTVLKSMKQKNIVVVGVGITEAGAPVLTTYAPHALVVEDVQKLPITLAELLKEHLKDI